MRKELGVFIGILALVRCCQLAKLRDQLWEFLLFLCFAYVLFMVTLMLKNFLSKFNDKKNHGRAFTEICWTSFVVSFLSFPTAALFIGMVLK